MIRDVKLIGIGLAILAGCSTAATSETPAYLTPQETAAADVFVRPGDQVALHIWNEPEMSDTFSVASDGLVTLPRLGAVRVDGRSVREIETELREAYSEYLHNPSVDVVVLRRVGVIGEVKFPGLYLADLTMTLPDLIARAGGATPAGNPNDITLFRGSREFHFGADDRERLALTDIQSGDQIVIGERSFFARNSLAVVSTAVPVLTLIAQILLSGI